MSPDERDDLALAVFLVALAGFVDAVGFLILGSLFVSFMSGNSTQFAIRLGRSLWAGAGAAGTIVGVFVVGAVAGRLIATAAGRWRRSAILALEAACLGFAAGVSLPPLGAGALMAFAMGAQNGVLQAAGRATTGLTYITGSLVKFSTARRRHDRGGPRLGPVALSCALGGNGRRRRGRRGRLWPTRHFGPRAAGGCGGAARGRRPRRARAALAPRRRPLKNRSVTEIDSLVRDAQQQRRCWFVGLAVARPGRDDSYCASNFEVVLYQPRSPASPYQASRRDIRRSAPVTGADAERIRLLPLRCWRGSTLTWVAPTARPQASLARKPDPQLEDAEGDLGVRHGRPPGLRRGVEEGVEARFSASALAGVVGDLAAATASRSRSAHVRCQARQPGDEGRLAVEARRDVGWPREIVPPAADQIVARRGRRNSASSRSPRENGRPPLRVGGDARPKCRCPGWCPR